MTTPHVLYVGPFAQKTGYGQAAHDYMLALHRAGVSLEIQPIAPCEADDLDERYHELFALTRGHPDHTQAKRPTHVIIHTVPAALPVIAADYDDAIKIAITTWETTQIPRRFADAIDEAFDAVIVPSVFCAYALREVPGVTVIPHCFDPEHWPVPEEEEEDRYAFYSILGWAERKNPIGLLKAYFAEFSSDDDVVLRLKASDANSDDIAALMSALGYSDIPRIEIVDEYFDHDEMVEFHHQNDCFVTAARGEGWNLPAFEAALLGRHVIAPGFGGHLDFMRFSPQQYQNVHYAHTPAIVPPQVSQQVTEIAGMRLRAVHQTAPSGITARQMWCEPNLGNLQVAMRNAYNRRYTTDLSARKTFEERFSYATIGAQLADLIDRTRRPR